MKTRSLKLIITALILFSALAAQPQSSLASVQATDLRISQVYGGGGNTGATYTNDFIELFNAGTTPIDLTGFSVQYASSTGTTWQVTALGGSIGAGKYFLVQQAAGAGGTTPLPTPDVIGTIAMSGTNGKVALVNSTTALSGSCPTGLVDQVGYGSANCYEGAGAAPVLSNTIADFRALAGCQDTDVNSADFSTAAPAPRNSASPGTTCATDTAPSVSSSTPADSATDVALDSNIAINFSEDVTVTGTWFDISCTVSGSHTAAVSGGPASYTLNPDADFVADDVCTVTVYAAQVTDDDSDDPPDNMAADHQFAFSTPTTFTPTFVINEINADPDATNGDANGDGTVSTTQDEFVEIVNTSGVPVDISGWTLSDAVSVRHTFPANTVLPDMCSIVVFSGGTPTGLFGSSYVQTASSGSLGLNNGGDTVTLADATAAAVAITGYGTEGGDNQSLTRDPDVTGTDPLVKHATATGSGGALFSPGTMIDGTPFSGCTQKLLLTEIVVTPTGGEFIEIYNPGITAVDLSNVYLTDATFAGGSTYYYNLPTGTNAGGGGFSDFNARFPHGASIAAGEYQTVALAGSDNFFTEYGVNPTYELFEDGLSADAIPDMLEATTGSINNQGGLTNGGEVVILYAWDGASDLVVDLDYVLWVDTAEAVDKTGVSIDGPDAGPEASTYLPDTPLGSQDVIAATHAFGNSYQRNDLSEGTQVKSGGNGAAGRDETSEDVSNTWCETVPSPNTASDCPPEVYINELRVSGSPDAEYFELQGDPAQSLDGLTYVVLSSEFSPGNIDAAIPLSGTVIPADGFFVAADATAQSALSFTADITVSLTFFGSPVTHMLVRNFSGTVGADLDTDNDGTLDTEPWDLVLDSVALTDGDGTPDTLYSSVVVGPDGSFTPSGTYRCGDAPTGAFGNNILTFSPLDGTPGESNELLCLDITEAKIHDVQGSGSSVAITSDVMVEAIVVGDFQGSGQLSGFFIQEEDADADADATTSEGIFVYCGGCSVAVAVGDKVSVTGKPGEYFGMSQIDVTATGGEVVFVSSGNTLPTPATIDLPASGSTKAEATFESIEGMLVSFSDTLFVSEYFELARYDQLVLTADARPHQFTDAYEPSVSGYADFLADLNKTRIILDNDNNRQNDSLGATPAEDKPIFWPRPGLSNTNFIRGGDSIANLTGVLHWSYAGQSGTDAWRIRPVEEAFTYDFTSNNARPTAAPEMNGTLKVASFNVLNYFTTLNSRGADSTAELDRQRAKTAAAICAVDADIVGLMEIENNGATALEDLLNGTDGVNANCGPYAYIDTGVIGTDQIVVAFIYKPATVTPKGDYAVLDTTVDPRFLDDKNRPALAQTFEENSTGEVFTIVVNHLKSKGSSCNDVSDPDLLDGQGNCNMTRTLAAQAMVDWLAGDPTGSGDPDFLIIGDLNSYRMEDPIDAIKAGADDTAGTGDDYTDLMDYFNGAGAYSYLFDGQLGYLDHALASSHFLQYVMDVKPWHINADEIPVFDYNDDILDAGESSFERESTSLPIYEDNAYRASDHDPVVISIDLMPYKYILLPIFYTP